MKIIVGLLALFALTSTSLKAQTNNSSTDTTQQRELIKTPNFSEIVVPELCKVSLKVKIDENGDVVELPIVSMAQTTTSDPEVIKKVKEIVYQQAKYSPLKGSDIVTVFLIIKLRPKAT